MLNELNYRIYGTTVRPIRKVAEFETETGHLYLPFEIPEKLPKDYSETSTNGKKIDWCFGVCLGVNGRHARYHR